MMIRKTAPHPIPVPLAAALLALVLTVAGALPGLAQSNGFRQALAQAVAGDPEIAAFYAARDYKPIWVSRRDKQRRKAFLGALRRAPAHGLATKRYDAKAVSADFSRLRGDARAAEVEVRTTRRFVQYAHDIQSGIVAPARVDANMTLPRPRRGTRQLLESFSKSTPAAFIRVLPPQNKGYALLLKEKARVQKIAAQGGWGPKVGASVLKPGQAGAAVAQLKARLNRMGYRAGSGNSYDTALAQAVARFQTANSLNPDGVAGKATMVAVNTSASTRLMQVVLGLERMRWLNKPLGQRHIVVNEAAFVVNVYDRGRSVYDSRVVVGKPGRWRTPEFQDQMTHLIINPSWHVPPAIAGLEYLPLLKKNSNALARQDMVMTNTSGQVVNPASVDFAQYTKDSFPYSLRQKPSGGNALGKVKFLFPNKHAIYLHDTPSKSLFGRDLRAYSHGCVRVQKPDELAYLLLGWQAGNAKALFDQTVASGKETRIDLKSPIPIYLVYRTAFAAPNGSVRYAPDTYGVDGKLWSALKAAGVSLNG